MLHSVRDSDLSTVLFQDISIYKRIVCIKLSRLWILPVSTEST